MSNCKINIRFKTTENADIVSGNDVEEIEKIFSDDETHAPDDLEEAGEDDGSDIAFSSNTLSNGTYNSNYVFSASSSSISTLKYHKMFSEVEERDELMSPF